MRQYLIQRDKFTNSPNQKDIDSILGFNYMGSAEFEFNALPKSLKRIRNHMHDYHLFECIINNKKITVFCKKENKPEICIIINGLADNKFNLKEYCDLFYYIKEKDEIRSDFWWDIENDYMFWKYNPEFDDKFIKLIKPKTNK